MDHKQVYRSKSWQEKESVKPGPAGAPEVYYNESDLEHVPENLGAVYKNNVFELNQQHKKSSSSKRWRRWLLPVIAVILVCLAIGLGVGLHFRSYSYSNNTTSQQSTSSNTSNPSTTSTTSTTVPVSITSSSSTSAATSMASTTPVTSGSTGIAADDCRTRGSSDYTTINNPTDFTFDCGADYPGGWPAHSVNKTVGDLTHAITYTFEDCMEHCAFYNAQSSTTTQCLAITYAANLTSSIAKFGANCWLKSERGQPYYGNAIYLPSSAYFDLG